MSIRILPPSLANRIAAGEVVERPASVVKELLENSLDAGASRIRVVVGGGGINLIEVTDNGGGIPKDELALAFRRHATSKLADGDLTKIATLGFRGEALAAIASVSEVEIVSTHGGRAWRLGAGEAEPSPAASIGTRLTVRGLFRQLPARLKFLKTAAAEYAAIHEVFVRLALAHPQVEMSLEADNHKPLRFAIGGDAAAQRLQRAAELLGREFPNIALPLLARAGDWSVSGWIGVPTYHRRNGILSFVNRRAIRDRAIIASLKGAYGDTVTAGKMPAAALFLECPPNQVDVNVHPSKAEVRFRNSRALYGFIVHSLRDALTAAPLRTSSEKFQTPPATALGDAPNLSHASRRARYHSPANRPTLDLRSRAAAYAPAPSIAPAAAASPPASPMVSPGERDGGGGQFRIFGQVHSKYIVAESLEGDGGLVIIDQHAAHERIIYERLKAGLKTSPPPRQVLLTPQIVDLPPKRRQHLLENVAALQKLGLILEEFGAEGVAVREIPAILEGIDLDKLVNEIAVSYGEKRAYLKHLEAVCSLMACHAAIRGHRPMSSEEMEELLGLMRKTPNASQCNHGRPAIITLSAAELNKLFERS